MIKQLRILDHISSNRQNSLRYRRNGKWFFLKRLFCLNFHFYKVCPKVIKNVRWQSSQCDVFRDATGSHRDVNRNADDDGGSQTLAPNIFRPLSSKNETRKVRIFRPFDRRRTSSAWHRLVLFTYQPTYLPTYLWLNRSIEQGYNWSIECYRISVIICWNSKGPNFTQKLPKKWLKQFLSLIVSFFIIFEKVGKYFAYFCKKICCQYCLKVAQSAHTE